jgi:CubicO group peptidase (beta-lactamase class C family)
MTDFEPLLDEKVPALLGRHKLPGLALALIDEGAVSLIKCYGYADAGSRQPLDRSGLFKAASISKSVTAWGIMRLVEQGALDLDAPVDDYLRRWKLPQTGFDTTKVTPRLLLCHRAGTTLAGCSVVPYDVARPTLLQALEGNMPPVPEAQREYARLWNKDPATYNVPVALFQSPDAGYCYSGGGYMILELLIAEVTGQRFADYMARAVLQPLEMRRSSFDPEDLSELVTAHDSSGQPIARYRTNGLAAGGLICSIDDLATFACAGLQGCNGEAPGRGLISPAAVAAMYAGEGFAESVNGIDYQSGLGHLVGEIAGRRFAMHTGGNLGWRSVFNIVPESGRGIAVLANGAAGNPVWMEIMKLWRGTLK